MTNTHPFSNMCWARSKKWNRKKKEGKENLEDDIAMRRRREEVKLIH